MDGYPATHDWYPPTDSIFCTPATARGAARLHPRRLRAAAAYELGISETTVRQHLSELYRRTGCVNAAQAAYWLGAGGRAR